MKVNSYDKKYTFTDALGTVNTFFNSDRVSAARSFRDRLVQIEGYNIDRALKVIKHCTMKCDNEVIKSAGEDIV